MSGCGVLVACLLILFAGDTSYEQHHNSARGAVRIAAVGAAASRRKPSGHPATNSRELLLQHTEALSTATNQFNDTVYERLFSRSAEPPRCLEQCDIVPEPESRPTKSYNRVAIACPTALFVGPQYMYCEFCILARGALARHVFPVSVAAVLNIVQAWRTFDSSPFAVPGPLILLRAHRSQLSSSATLALPHLASPSMRCPGSRWLRDWAVRHCSSCHCNVAGSRSWRSLTTLRPNGCPWS